MQKIRQVTALWLGTFLVAGTAQASETDQYYGREIPIRDSSAIINERVNDAITKAVREWDGPRDDHDFAEKVRWNVDGTLFVGRISFWADAHPEIDKIDTPMSESIYAKLLPWESFLPLFRFLSATLSIDSGEPGRTYRFGADKLTHMLSVGWNYYGRYVQHGTESSGIQYGWYTEAQILGYGSNGAFSNGDLVANYEGLRFYRGLTEDGIVMGKPSIVRWENDTPVIQRAFSLADHASEYWDESINNNMYRRSVERRVRRKVREYCDAYRASPALYDIAPEIESSLDARYSHLMLRKNKTTRVSKICAGK